MTYPYDIQQFCKLRGYSAEYTAYWLAHPKDEARTGEFSVAPHHIRTRGAGGGDEAGNLLALSWEKHREIEKGGTTRFCERHPWLRYKIEAALAARRVPA